MAIAIPDGEFLQLSSATWLDGVTKLSAAGWIRFDTTLVAGKTYVFSHYSTGDIFSLRKESTSHNWKAVIKAAGVTVIYETTPVAVDTIYHFALTWEQGSATGFKVYIDGTELGSPKSTTGQGTYDTAGGDLLWGARNPTSDKNGAITLEGFAAFPGVTLRADQVLALRALGFPHFIGLRPGGLWPGLTLEGTTLPDWSGNGRKITGVPGPVSASATIGRYQTPRLRLRAPNPSRATLAGGAVPGPWIEAGVVPAGTEELIISGLTPGVSYESYVVAEDAAGNVSAPSSIVEAEALSVEIKHVTRKVFLGG